MTGTILVTGAGGYVGGLLTAALRAKGASVLPWLHAHDEREARKKAEALLPPRHRFAWGDLGEEDPFAGIDAAEIGAVVHAAAVIRFTVDEATANQVNRDGTAKALAFAARCPRLTRFLEVSTLYAAGLGIRVPETILWERPDFANHYERSKWCAEALVARSRLPWRIARLPTLIADDERGGVSQRNAFHNTLTLFHRGLLPLLPGDPGNRIPLATAEAVTHALTRLLFEDDLPPVVNLCPRRESMLRLGSLLEIAAEIFANDPRFRRRGVMTPPLLDREGFSLFAAGIGTLGPGIQAQALASLLPFAPQLYLDKEIDSCGGRASCPELESMNAASIVAAACHTLIHPATHHGEKS
ncbi:MAG TPA: SDR family oxidoreductase [Stellaceae bacterium]|nr:SDR family oxidoreductase [Stellaceae bacterium]